MARFTPRGIEHVEVVQRAVKPFLITQLAPRKADLLHRMVHTYQ
jgi:hypothetical protein